MYTVMLVGNSISLNDLHKVLTITIAELKKEQPMNEVQINSNLGTEVKAIIKRVEVIINERPIGLS